MKYAIKEKDMILKIAILTLALILLILLTLLNPFSFSVIHDYFLMASIALGLVVIGIYVTIHYISQADSDEKKVFRYYYFHVMDFVMMLLVSLVVLMTLFVFVFFPAKVQQSSMRPTLRPEDRLIVSLQTKDLNRFDIVVIETDRMGGVNSGLFEEGDLLIKRIIGMPGDNFYFQNGIFYLQDKEDDQLYEVVLEPFLRNKNGDFYFGATSTKTNDFRLEDVCFISNTSETCNMEGRIQIPADYYFVMGDNRDYSVDSREIGLIHKNQIIGRATLYLEGIFKIYKLK